LLRRSADVGWGAGGDAGSQDIEVRLVAPGVSVADDIETTLGAGDGHVEQIGLSGREPARAGPVRIAAEDEDDDIGFLALLLTAGYAASLRRGVRRPECDINVRLPAEDRNSVSRKGNMPVRSEN
jgi:hypothetical protein